MSAPALPYAFAKAHGILVAGQGAEHAQLLLRESASLEALAEVRRSLGLPLQIENVSRATFEARLSEAYSGTDGNAAEVVADVGQEVDLTQLMTELPAVEDLLETQDDAPIIRMINALLTQAVRQAASDIHIEPYERHSVVRFRRDGVLVDVAQPHRALHAAMASRIKIMASLDIAEKRLPQDGRIALRLAGRQVDVRVSTLPTTHGERIVLRLLDKGSGQRGLDSLGMAADTVAPFAKLLDQPHGILLVTGPTGSGKTSTLYATLKQLATPQVNLCTLEDPIEMIEPAFNQMQVQPGIDLTFANGVRALLRQDPDIIMLGEIRDLETAEVAIQAALTGHLVLSTLHTNDAPSAISRLLELGVAPYLIKATLLGVMAQRLVRTLCPDCKAAQPLSPDAWSGFAPGWAHAPPITVYRPVGCTQCRASGYRGRIGVCEIMVLSEQLKALIGPQTDLSAIRQLASAQGMLSLRLAAAHKVASAATSLEEALRVTPA